MPFLRQPRSERPTESSLGLETLESRDYMAANVLPDPLPNQNDAVPHGVATPGSSAGLNRDVQMAHEFWGLFGDGQTVVVIDSGIAYDHPALGGGFGAGRQVVGGWDFAEGDANPYDDLPGGLHGTHVAGIIGSSDPRFPGVAPKVDLIALRIFDDSGSGGFERIESALQWVLRNRNAFENPISVVNISIGSDSNGDAPPQWSTMEDELSQLVTHGILVTASAGNAFDSTLGAGLSYPAASPFVLPVGAADQNGILSSYSQRNTRILVAPGDNVVSTVPDYAFDFNGRTDDFMSLSGTSMAAPFVAGASVLLREAIERTQNRTPRGDEIQAILRQTADPRWDSVTRTSYAHLDLLAAIQAVIPQDEVSSASQPRQLGRITQDQTITGVIQNSDDRDYFTFQAGRSGLVAVDLGWNADDGQEPTLLVQDASGHYRLIQDTIAVTAGQTYRLCVSSGGSLGCYSIQLATATPPIAVPQTPYRSGVGASESRLQWTAVTSETITVNLQFVMPEAISSFSIRDLRSGGVVARIQDPGRVEALVLPVLAGQRFEFIVSGQNTDTQLVIQRRSQGGGTPGPVILATRLSHNVADAQAVDVALRVHNGKPAVGHLPSSAEIGADLVDASHAELPQSWMAEAAPKSPIPERSGYDWPIAWAEDGSSEEAITAVRAALDALGGWYDVWLDTCLRT